MSEPCDLTADRVRAMLNYDPSTGHLTWRESRGTRMAGTIAGTPNHSGYLRVSVDCQRHFAHRLAWLHVHGEWPSAQVDHINLIKSDNRIANLRDVAPSANQQNRQGAMRGNRLGVLGVNVTASGRFEARIKYDGRQRSLGTFSTAQEAHDAYLNAKRKHHSGATVAPSPAPDRLQAAQDSMDRKFRSAASGAGPEPTALELAVRFHETYERLAPSFGYETRADTKVFDPTSKNGRLMVAVCAALAVPQKHSADPVASGSPLPDVDGTV